MRALLLDYQLTQRPARRSEQLLLIAGLIATVVVALHYRSSSAMIEQLQSQQIRLEQQTNRHKSDSRISSLDAQQLRAEIKQANAVLAQLGLPWESLFRDIESSQRQPIALLVIEPDAEKHAVRITGEARDLPAVLSYIKYLQKKPSLTNIYLQSHQVDLQTAEKPIRFVITAAWVITP
ncbi:MAG: PilN domain-containing protein [Gammaproteobacteria bacterium]|nr:PilN domain-containing protein [Gammaproteobacteria bacterium]